MGLAISKRNYLSAIIFLNTFIMEHFQSLQSEQERRMNPYVPHPQVSQLLIFYHSCFIYISPQYTQLLQFLLLVLLGNLYTLKYTNVDLQIRKISYPK